ncbi:phage portal protein [Sphingomonas sp. R647]|uniref:phage portal protein n=1 Tax=Sphingomonas sp. R647 TaxID=2875233 RepID=UPI001CD3F3CD|nr:phage portal protein [Sphingomonas sp. R647]MCA1199121.1 phage portal protein [Sphingomonas sp. R647]
MSEQLPAIAETVETVEGEVIASGGRGMTFAFGEAESVRDRRMLMMECWHNGRWYEPPVSRDGLARAFDAAPHHASAIKLKVNLLARQFIPSRWLNRDDFMRFALDFLTMGDGYLERRDNLAGRPMALKHSLSRYTRRGVVDGEFFFVPGWRQEHEFRPGTVFQLSEHHPSQEIYGVPYYMGGLQSTFLNESATIFRRRYYDNGSHAGFILYLNGTDFGSAETEAIRKAMKDAKGPGNFKNMFLHVPGGKEHGVKVIPIAEVAAKDDFMPIKNTSRDDMLATHRTPPQLLGVVPTNSGGFGDVGKASDIYFFNEIEPLQGRMLEVNEFVGLEAVAFRPYERVGVSGGTG